MALHVSGHGCRSIIGVIVLDLDGQQMEVRCRQGSLNGRTIKSLTLAIQTPPPL